MAAISSFYKRKALHISMVSFALLIGRLPAWAISMAAISAFLFNLWILPRIGKSHFDTPEDQKRGFSLGMLAYPAVLTLISLLWYNQQVYMAIAWGILAFGDAFAAIVGRRLPWIRLPWNKDKTLSGTLSFVVAGTLFTWLLLHALPESVLLNVSANHWIVFIFPAAIAAALVESVDTRTNDNITVPLVAALVAFSFVQYGDSSMFAAYLDTMWVAGALCLVALLALWAKKVDTSGAVVGVLLGTVLFAGTGYLGVVYLAALFVLGTLASVIGYRKKQKIGIAEGNKGSRSAANALANVLVAAVCAVLAGLQPAQHTLYTYMMAAALIAATADTLSSELGSIYGKRFFYITTFKSSPPGPDGVVSPAGLWVVLISSLVLSCVVADIKWIIVITLSSVAGNYIDSLLGATLEKKELLDNHQVNFLCTLTAALCVGVSAVLFNLT